MAWVSQSRGPSHNRSAGTGTSHLVFAPKDSESQKQKFFLKDNSFEVLIKIQIIKKIHAP